MKPKIKLVQCTHGWYSSVSGEGDGDATCAGVGLVGDVNSRSISYKRAGSFMSSDGTHKGGWLAG